MASNDNVWMSSKDTVVYIKLKEHLLVWVVRLYQTNLLTLTTFRPVLYWGVNLIIVSLKELSRDLTYVEGEYLENENSCRKITFFFFWS